MVAHIRGSNWEPYSRIESGKSIFSDAFFLITRPAGEWVAVFFLLSGFLICQSVLRRSAKGDFDFYDYIAERTARIYTPFLPCLLLTFALTYALTHTVDGLHIIGCVLNLQGTTPFFPLSSINAPLWSLPYEWHIYVLFGLVAALVSPAMRLKKSSVVLGLLGIFALSMLSSVHVLCWCIGAMAAMLSNRNPSLRTCWQWAGAAMMLAGFVIHQLSSQTIVGGKVTIQGWGSNPSLLMISMGGAICILAQLRIPQSLPVWITKIATGAAAISYSLYLTHYPLTNYLNLVLGGKFKSFDNHSFGIFLVKCAASILLATLFWWLFERHTPKVANYLKGKFRQV